MAGFQLRVEQRRGALAIDRTSLSPLRAGHGQGRIGRPLWPYPQRDASCCLHVACASRGVSLGSRCVSHFYLACCTFCVAFLRALGSDSKGSAAWRLGSCTRRLSHAPRTPTAACHTALLSHTAGANGADDLIAPTRQRASGGRRQWSRPGASEQAQKLGCRRHRTAATDRRREGTARERGVRGRRGGRIGICRGSSDGY